MTPIKILNILKNAKKGEKNPESTAKSQNKT